MDVYDHQFTDFTHRIVFELTDPSHIKLSNHSFSELVATCLLTTSSCITTAHSLQHKSAMTGAKK